MLAGSHAGRGTRVPPTRKLARSLNTSAFIITNSTSRLDLCRDNVAVFRFTTTLEQRGACQAARKSHKTTRIVGWVVGRDSLSTGRDSHKPTHRTISCIQRWLRRSRPQHQLAAGVAQFELSERVAHVVEREDSGNRHFQLTPCDEVGQLGDHLCRCGIRAAF